MNTESQKLAIQRHLSKPGRTITPREARRLCGCDRLAARMYELKGDGWPVDGEKIDVGLGKRVKRYWFKRPARACRKVRK
jgi:hypothetical protein